MFVVKQERKKGDQTSDLLSKYTKIDRGLVMVRMPPLVSASFIFSLDPLKPSPAPYRVMETYISSSNVLRVCRGLRTVFWPSSGQSK